MEHKLQLLNDRIGTLVERFETVRRDRDRLKLEVERLSAALAELEAREGSERLPVPLLEIQEVLRGAIADLKEQPRTESG